MPLQHDVEAVASRHWGQCQSMCWNYRRGNDAVIDGIDEHVRPVPPIRFRKSLASYRRSRIDRSGSLSAAAVSTIVDLISSNLSTAVMSRRSAAFFLEIRKLI